MPVLGVCRSRHPAPAQEGQALTVNKPNQWRHAEACEANAIALLRREPSSVPPCTCGLDEAIARRDAPTIADVLRYADSDEGARDCEMRTDLRWHDGNPVTRDAWFEQLVRNYAAGTILQKTDDIHREISRDFRIFWERERFRKTGTPQDECIACGETRSEHSDDPPHACYRNGCPGFGVDIFEETTTELSKEELARPEAKLLLALRARCDRLEKIQHLIEPNVGGLEDCVYRFWHQSFKVSYAKGITRDVTDVLVEAALESGADLHPWYREIVDAQAKFAFDVSMNAEWSKHTRPVIDAFLHATWILGAVLRTLSRPPKSVVRGILSYDWATILCVFQLR